MLKKQKSPQKPPQLITLRGAVNTYTAYGQLTCNITTALAELGYDPFIYPISVDKAFGSEIPRAISPTRLVFKYLPGQEWEFALYSPMLAEHKQGVKRVMLTMWETDKLKPEHVKNLNKCHAIITPSRWCYETFKTSGVRVPVYLLPLGFDSDSFYPNLLTFPPVRVFGAAGRLAHGGIRKGLTLVIEAFQKAFPIEGDAKLKLKVFPDCALGGVFDSRIEIVRENLSKTKLREWYQSLSCFVSMGTSEGWGLHQVEALACGRPVMSVNYGGVREFFKPEVNGYEIAHKVVKSAVATYEGVGKWAQPSVESCVEQMRRVYENPVEAFCLGLQGAQDVKELSFKNFMQGLVGTLKRIGVIK